MYKITKKTLQIYLYGTATLLAVIGLLLGLVVQTNRENKTVKQQLQAQYESGYKQAILDCTPIGFDQEGKLIITYNGIGHLYDVDTKELGLSLIPFL